MVRHESMMSSRVNISQAHVHFGIIREHPGRREKKFPGDLHALSTRPLSLIALGNYCFSAKLLNVYFQLTKPCSEIGK